MKLKIRPPKKAWQARITGRTEKESRGGPYNTTNTSSPDKSNCTGASTNLVATCDNLKDEVDQATRKRVAKTIHEHNKNQLVHQQTG